MAKITRGVSETNPKTSKHVMTFNDLKECTLVTKNGLKMAVAIDEMTHEHCLGEDASTTFTGRILTSSGAVDRIRREWNDRWGIPDGYRTYYAFADIIETQKLADRMAITIKNVIFNDPATIVFWQDGTKTVVKAQDGDEFDPEKGLAMAIAKKVYGNQGNYCNQLKKWLPKEEKPVDIPNVEYNPSMEEMTNTITKAWQAIKEGILNPKPKKRMTFREEVAKLEPERISPCAWGGVQGCPRDQRQVVGPCPIADTVMTKDERCRKCWDREIPDELMRDDI